MLIEDMGWLLLKLMLFTEKYGEVIEPLLHIWKVQILNIDSSSMRSRIKDI